MNLRTIKKLSKRAAPLLPLLGDHRKQFPAGHPNECRDYHALYVGDRKHWERSPCHESHKAGPSGFGCGDDAIMTIRITTRDGRALVMRPPSHPRKGTIMVGAMSGYEEPEWKEQTAYEALIDAVHMEFTDWGALAAAEDEDWAALAAAEDEDRAALASADDGDDGHGDDIPDQPTDVEDDEAAPDRPIMLRDLSTPAAIFAAAAEMIASREAERRHG